MDAAPASASRARAPLFRRAALEHGEPTLRRVALLARTPRWPLLGAAYAIVIAATMACVTAVARIDGGSDDAAQPHAAAVACPQADTP